MIPPHLKFLETITPASSELDVEHNIVIPLLRLLGYEDEDWQTQAAINQSKADFLIHPKEFKKNYSPYLIIEAKAASKKLAQSGWQINGYMREAEATLGLLTNGYRFRILVRYEEQIMTIAEYSQAELVVDFKRFFQLLCKSTCLKFGNAVLRSRKYIDVKFLEIISEEFPSETMFELFKRRERTYKNRTAKQSGNISAQGVKRSMIITVFNNKGGVGKTTLTVNLATALEKLGKRVLLIDIDAQANLTTGLGIDPLNDVEIVGKKDITHLLIEPKTKLEDVIYRKRWNTIQLDIIPSHIRLSGMESELNRIVDSDRILAKKLRKHDYDFVFIDPPPSFSKVNSISLMASSAILIPTQLSPYPIRALEYVIEQAHRVEDYKDEPLPILGVAVSMYDQRSTSYNLSMIEALKQTLAKNADDRQISLFPENTWIPRLNIVSQCPEQGYPIHQAEFDDQLSHQDREAAQKAIERYEQLALHLTSMI